MSTQHVKLQMDVTQLEPDWQAGSHAFDKQTLLVTQEQ